MLIRFAASATLAIVSATFLAPVHRQAASVDSPAALFRALEGHWGCNGGFPDGRKLAADLTFATAQDARVVRFTHVDRPPSSYWQEATWAFDAKSSRVYSLSTSGANTNQNSSPALFTAHLWADSAIALVADSLNGPPWTPNRFSYTLSDGAHLSMRWELQRPTGWVLGDSLVCTRTKQ